MSDSNFIVYEMGDNLIDQDGQLTMMWGPEWTTVMCNGSAATIDNILPYAREIVVACGGTLFPGPGTVLQTRMVDRKQEIRWKGPR